jgi:ketosteroid isomerase-like protein
VKPLGTYDARRHSDNPFEQRIHALYAALARRDLAELALQLATDVIWSDAGFAAPTKTYRGRVEVVDYLARLISETHGSYQLTMLDLHVSSTGRYVVREREAGQRQGQFVVHEPCLRVDVGPHGITHFERFNVAHTDTPTLRFLPDS